MVAVEPSTIVSAGVVHSAAAVVDHPESESELGGGSNFHLAAEIEVGEHSDKCYSKGYGRFTRAQAEALLKSCQSVTK